MKAIQCPKCKKTKIAVLEGMGMCWDCGYRFSLTDAAPENNTKTFCPMHLFLSYGRPENPIVQKIYEAIKERGHTAWFDESEIRTGYDWRTQIQRGVENSQGVVACLSEHAVRDRGVCLDELAIAVGVKGAGCIHSVLLGPEKVVNPPATVGQNQWLDMSDWREKMNQGDAVFQPWFDAKMQELFAVLENKDNREFVGQISEIKSRLNVYYDTSLQNEYLKKEFVGRRWLERQLKKWLDDPDGERMAFVYGEPGIGKTAFSVHYTHYNPRVAACLFCRAKMDTFNDPKTVIQTLAYLLACRLPSYRRSLLATMPETKEEIQCLSEQELFSQLLANPLSITIDGGFPTTVIVLDGLDECSGDPRENTLARTLYTYMNSLPRWLRLLVVARPTAPVRQYTRLAREIEIPGQGQQNLENIREYFEKGLKPLFGEDPRWGASLRSMTARSQGVFLYAEMLSVLLRKKGRLEAVNEYPDGLDGVFSQWFAWFFPNLDEYAARWRLPLGCLIGAPAPLPEEELKKMFGWGDNELSDLVLRLDVLLSHGVNEFGDRTLAISHAYVRQWLGSEPGSHAYCTSPMDGVRKMAEAFYASFRDDPTKLTFYEAVQLPGLLKQTGDEKRYGEAIESNDLLWRILNARFICYTSGKLEEAKTISQQALQISEEADGRIQDQTSLKYVCICQNFLGGILSEMGDIAEALQAHRKAVAIAERLAVKRGTLWNRRNLWVSYEKMAGIRKKQGKLAEASELYEKGLVIAEQLVAERDSTEERLNLSLSYNLVAGVRKEQGDLDGALKFYEKALMIGERLVAERGTPEERLSLPISYIGVADIREAKGDFDGALELYEKALAIAEQLVTEYGIHWGGQSLSVGYNKVAGIRKKRGDLDGALELYEKGLAVMKKLVAEHNTPAKRLALSSSYNQVADIRKIKGDLAGALELYEKSLTIRDRLATECGTPDERRALAISCEKVAGIRKTQRDLNGALKLYKKSLTIKEQLIKECGTPEDWRNLSLIYSQLADIRMMQNNPDRASELYKKSFTIREQLVAECGTVNDYDDLMVAYLKMAGIQKILEESGEETAVYQLYVTRGRAIARRLLDQTGQQRYRQAIKAFDDLDLI